MRKLKLRLRHAEEGEDDDFEDLDGYWLIFGCLSYLSRHGKLPSERLDVEAEEEAR